MLPVHESLENERFTVLKEGFVAICTYIEKGKVKTNYCAARLLNFYVNRYNKVITTRVTTKHVFYCSDTESIKMEASVSYLEKQLLFEYSQNTIRAANKFLASHNLITIHRTENNNIHESNYVSINLCAIQEAEKPYKETWTKDAFDPQIRDGKLVFNGGGYCKFEVPPTANLKEGYFKFGYTNINTTIKEEEEEGNFSFSENSGLETNSDLKVSAQNAAPVELSVNEYYEMVVDSFENESTYKAYSDIKKSLEHKGTEKQNEAFIKESIAFWIESDKFKKPFILNPCDFFIKNYRKSLKNHIKKTMTAK